MFAELNFIFNSKFHFNSIFIFIFKALIDFCTDGAQFIRENMSNETIKLLEFYRKCNPTTNGHNHFPSVTKFEKINEEFLNIREMSEKFDEKIEILFNNNTKETVQVVNYY